MPDTTFLGNLKIEKLRIPSLRGDDFLLVSVFCFTFALEMKTRINIERPLAADTIRQTPFISPASYAGIK